MLEKCDQIVAIHNKIFETSEQMQAVTKKPKKQGMFGFKMTTTRQ